MEREQSFVNTIDVIDPNNSHEFYSFDKPIPLSIFKHYYHLIQRGLDEMAREEKLETTIVSSPSLKGFSVRLCRAESCFEYIYPQISYAKELRWTETIRYKKGTNVSKMLEDYIIHGDLPMLDSEDDCQETEFIFFHSFRTIKVNLLLGLQ